MGVDWGMDMAMDIIVAYLGMISNGSENIQGSKMYSIRNCNHLPQRKTAKMFINLICLYSSNE